MIARLNREGLAVLLVEQNVGAVAGDRAPRLRAGERQPALRRPAGRPAGQRRAAPRLPGAMNTAPATLAQKLIARAAGAQPGDAGRGRHLPRRPGDVPRLQRPAPAAADAGRAGRDDLGQGQGGAGHRPLRARGGRGIAPHRAHRARLGGRAARCRMSTTRWASATWCCRSTGTCGRACSASAATRIRPPAGAFGAYMFGIGATEMLGVVVTGEIWLQRAADDLHALERPPGRRRQRQGHDAGDARPPRHERRPLPGGGVLRRGGARAVACTSA